MDPLSYFSFLPVIRNWSAKAMVCTNLWNGVYKNILLLIGKSSLGRDDSRFLSE